ncbi:MAG: hypothetical protein KAS53_05110 [Candidatus Cloacimonetes bacterium]|nr:hypothetical protein [Candidatus Cloacimonadota bacterium]
MTQEEINILLDTTHKIPVVLRNETFPNNTPSNQLSAIAQNGFSFTGRELLHAIGSKTASLPSSNQDECVNAAILYAHILDFQSHNLGYKTTINIDSDLQTNRSNELGIGVGCLIANKIFNVDWDTLESIRGLGRRFDYRATRPQQKYVYEFKGTKYRYNQKTQIDDGLNKKKVMHERKESYDVELIISTHIGFSNETPRIIIADPPFEGLEYEFTEDAELLYRLRHLSRIAQFIGNTPLSRIYYNQSKKFVRKKTIGESERFDRILVSTDSRALDIPFRIDKISEIKIQNKNFIGRWVSDWQSEKTRQKRKYYELPKLSHTGKLEIFQGISAELYHTMMENRIYELKEKMKFEKIKLKSGDNVEYTTFSDGTIMGYKITNE